MRFVVIFIVSLHVQEFSSDSDEHLFLPPILHTEECLEEPWLCDQDEMIQSETDACRCGQTRRLSSRIVGGTFTAPYEFPWLTYLLRRKNGKYSGCGSTIINSRLIMTAAHCVTYKSQLEPVIIRKKIPLGNLDIYAHIYDRHEVKTVGSYIELEIQHVIVHPNYFRVSNLEDEAQFPNYDIALIVLSHDIDITHPDLNPVCLPKKTDLIDLFQSREAVIAGWGISDRNSTMSSKFTKKITVPLHSNKNCRKQFVNRTTRLDLFICADDIDETGAGPGDSGGPLMLQTSNDFLQIGIVSHAQTFPNEFPHFNTVTLYSRVTAFLPWINYHSSGIGSTWCKRKTRRDPRWRALGASYKMFKK